MPFSTDFSSHFALPLPAPRPRAVRYILTLLIVALASLLRLVSDPLLHDQMPYFMYVGSVVVATWLGGLESGLIATALSAFAGNYFFAHPRFDFGFRPEDMAEMGVFVGFALFLGGFTARWHRAERELRQLHAQATAYADDLRAILETVPAAVFVTHDATAAQIEGNEFAAEYLRVPWGANLSATAPSGAPKTFRAVKDGVEIPGERLPVQRAIALGAAVRDYEFDVVYGDGGRRTLYGSAVPLKGDDGEVRGAVGAFVDVSQQREAIERLRESEQRYSAIFENAPFAVSLTRVSDGTLVSVNRAFLRLFGYERGEVLGKDTVALGISDGDSRDRVENLLEEVGAVRDLVQVRTRKSGQLCTVRSNVEQVTVNGEPYVISIIEDITERQLGEEALRQSEAKLREQAAALEQANRLKDEFLATLSHELRTPLNAIVGWSDMLRQGAVQGDTIHRAIDSIYRNAKAQNEMIEDVLDVSRIVSGKMVLDMRAVDPAAVLAGAVESVRATAQAKSIDLASDIRAAATSITADATRLQQVFWNLLTNAIKFTPAGGVVRVSLDRVSGQILIAVTDTGIGIAADFVPHVFERFRQSDSSITRRHGGLGLGLAIVRHLVELHGGTVGATSPGEGQGATFTVTLPERAPERRAADVVRPGKATGAAVEAVRHEVPSASGIRVMVVDDENDAREMAASVLSHHGATVVVAGNAAEALDQLRGFDPHVLLLDIAMPDVDGYTLLTRIRQSAGHHRDVPAIAWTALARREDRERVLAHGFQQHLPKPVGTHALLEAVVEAYRRHGSGTVGR